MGVVAPLDVIQGVPIGALMFLKLLLVSLSTTQKEGDTIVGARDYHRRILGHQASRCLAAQPIGQHHGVIAFARCRVDLVLQLRSQIGGGLCRPR